MEGLELEFEEEQMGPPDYNISGRSATVKHGSEEIMEIKVLGYTDSDSKYEVSFDVEEEGFYTDFLSVGSDDDFLEEEEVNLEYIDEEGRSADVILDLDEDLPDDISRIRWVQLGDFLGNYRPGFNGPGAEKENTFTINYDNGVIEEEGIYDSLESYVEELHPDPEVRENADDVVDQVRDEMEKLGEEIEEELQDR